MDQKNIIQQNISGTSGGGELSLYQYFIASPLFAGFIDLGGNDRKMFLGDFANFSESMKIFLSSPETATLITTTGSKFNLSDKQTTKIGEAVREVVIGKTFIKDFPLAISSKLGVDDIKAGEIANKIISDSFQPIMEDIKRIQRSKFPDKIAELQKGFKLQGLNQPQRPPLQMPPRPLSQPQPTRPVAPIRPPLQIPPKPPQMGSLDGRVRPTPSSQLSQQFKVPPPLDTVNATQKSLEEELNKAAGVIDLRSAPKNQSSNE